MSDTRPGTSPPDPSQHWGPPPPDASNPSAQTPPAPPTAFGRPARWPAFTALIFALAALVVSLVGWFRPAPHNNQPPPKPSYTEQQTADAKAKVCGAFGELDRAVGVLKALPHGSDPVVEAVNIRQVFDVFSRHFFATLSEEPATPADLATAMRKQATSLEELVIGYQDGFTNADPEMQSSLHVNDATADTIRQLCK